MGLNAKKIMNGFTVSKRNRAKIRNIVRYHYTAKKGKPGNPLEPERCYTVYHKGNEVLAGLMKTEAFDAIRHYTNQNIERVCSALKELHESGIDTDTTMALCSL